MRRSGSGPFFGLDVGDGAAFKGHGYDGRSSESIIHIIGPYLFFRPASRLARGVLHFRFAGGLQHLGFGHPFSEELTVLEPEGIGVRGHGRRQHDDDEQAAGIFFHDLDIFSRDLWIS